MKTICVDVGHYGKYNAGRIKGYYESERMWKLSEYLIPELKAYGFNVVTTRKDQKKDLSLTNRAMVAVNNKADLFVSLHSNAAGSSLSTSSADINGVVVFHSVQQKNKTVANEIAKVVASAMGTTVNRVATNESTKRPGRDYYTVIDVAAYNKVPKVFIIEHGFHTGTKDCTLLMDDNVLKRIAIAEAAYFAELLGVKKPAEPVKPAKTAKYKVVTKSSALNVRAGASTSKQVIGSLKKGAVVDVVSVSNGWAKIVYNGGDGYVSATYLEKVEEKIDIPAVTLRYNSTGEDVRDLQTRLNKLGYNCGTVDGIFGAKTELAVKKFQKANGLSGDGIVGKNTWKKLLEA